MKYFDEAVRVSQNTRLTANLYKLSFQSPELARLLKPGHFLQIAVSKETDPFLRRPFTIYRLRGKTVEILYEVVGKGSALLAEKKRGDTMKVMGPLGNTFSMNLRKKIHVAIGGGVGIAPFVFLGQRIKIDHFLMGARNRQGLLPKKEFGSLWNKSEFSTEDGSFGTKGYVTECLKRLIADSPDPSKLHLFICGPRAMMKAVIALARRHGISGEASVDERMACGVGACLGCVVETTEGFKTSCREGTVFSFEKLIL